jgi:peptide/nickel transport system permease protein
LHRFLIHRLASMIATIVAVSVVIFMMVRLLPGNIIDIMFGGDATATPEAKDAAVRQLGLDGSYPHQ